MTTTLARHLAWRESAKLHVFSSTWMVEHLEEEAVEVVGRVYLICNYIEIKVKIYFLSTKVVI